VAYNHIRMWLPFFKEAAIGFVIVCTNYKAFDKLAKNLEEENLLYVKDPRLLRESLREFPNLKACFYFSNLGKNIYMIDAPDDPGVRHIFLGHGDSDKSASAHSFFDVYDEVWTAGQAGIDRFRNQGIGREHLRFRVIGIPRLRSILSASGERPDRGKRVLYLPTWEGTYQAQNYSSLQLADRFVSTLTENFGLEMTVKFHPLTEPKFFKSFRSRFPGVESYLHEKSIGDLLEKADFYLCDISAAVTEALAKEGPIFLYYPRERGIEVSRSNLSIEEYTYTFSTVEELEALFARVLEGEDRLKEKREHAREYILGAEETLEGKFFHYLEALKRGELEEEGAWRESAVEPLDIDRDIDGSFLVYLSDPLLDQETLKTIRALSKRHPELHFVIKHRKLYFALRAIDPGINFVLLKKARDVEKFLKANPGIKSILYFSHSPKNVHSLRYGEYLHGLLVKESSKEFHPRKSMRVYDRFFSLEGKKR